MTGTVAVTGATGFLGRSLVAECRARRLPVRVLARDRTAARALWGSDVEVAGGDLLDPSVLARFVPAEGTLFHLAYLRSGPGDNLAAAAALATAAANAGVARVVHCSTAVVSGPVEPRVIDERVEPRPRGGYQATKLAIEHALREALPPSVELAIVRPTEIVGPGGAGLRTMIDRLRTRPAAVNAAYRMIQGARRLNFVAVRNVVAALLHVASAPLAVNGDVFIAADDDDPDNNYRSVESLIRVALGRSPGDGGPVLPLSVLAPLFTLFPGRAAPDQVYSGAKLRRLGYGKVTTLRDTIGEVVAFELGAQGTH